MVSNESYVEPQTAWSELREAFRRSDVWIHLARSDLKVRYRNSAIGPWWLTIQTATMLVAVGYVYAELFQIAASTYLPYLTVSLVLWSWLAQMLVEGCAALSESAAMLRQVRLPVPSIFLRVLLRTFLVFLHSAALIPVVLLLLRSPVGVDTLLVVPGFALFVANCAWMMVLLGIAGLRFSDVSQMVVAALNLLMLVTPVFWSATLLPRAVVFVDYNPFYHLLELVRAPLLGQTPATVHWIWGIVMCLLGWALVVHVFARVRRDICYWV